MDSVAQWQLLPQAIAMGGHVRVGWEDNPYLPNGEPTQHNAQLVEVVVKMAEQIGRPIATVEEARSIAGCSGRQDRRSVKQTRMQLARVRRGSSVELVRLEGDEAHVIAEESGHVAGDVLRESLHGGLDLAGPATRSYPMSDATMLSPVVSPDEDHLHRAQLLRPRG